MQSSQLSPLTQSFMSILVSEIGDKTFFITAILAMTYSMRLVFLGSYIAMVLMTLLSCSFGFILPQLINQFYTDVLATGLFLYFGCKLMLDVFSKNEEGKEDEEHEAEIEVIKFNQKLNKQTDSSSISSQFGVIRAAIVLTFLAEWGDRSQITTIALATESSYTVLFGALLGHLVCTSVAVLGGKIVAQKISERMINLCGGLLFLMFAIGNVLHLIKQ